MLSNEAKKEIINARHSKCPCFGLCQQFEQVGHCAACQAGLEQSIVTNPYYGVVTEEADWSKKNKYPIFIILTYTGIGLSILTKKFTESEFTHAMIAFEPDLKVCYTMGANSKEENPDNRLGIRKTTPKSKYYKDIKTYYSVYVMYVDKATRDKMKKKMEYFLENENDYGFAVIGIVTRGALQIKKRKETNYMFCSELVATILNSGKDIGKDPSITRPSDLSELNDISLVNHGFDFYQYNPKVTKRNMKLVRNKQFDQVDFEYEDSMIPATEGIRMKALGNALRKDYGKEPLTMIEGSDEFNLEVGTGDGDEGHIFIDLFVYE